MADGRDRRTQIEFFDRARSLAREADFDRAINMFLEGLRYVPDALQEHQALRIVALQRKASGGMSLGLFETMKLNAVKRGPVDRMLACEKLLCYDPGNVDHLLAFGNAASEAGATMTGRWVRELIEKAQEPK